MAAAVFPAYLLARRVVSVPWAYFAAVADDRRAGAVLRADPRRGAVGVPGGDGRALAHRPCGRRPGALASLALAFGGLRRSPSPSRSQLAGAVRRPRRRAARALAGAREWMRRWRATWTTLGPRRRRRARRRRGCSSLAAFIGHRSNEWETATSALEGPHGRVRELGGRRVRDRRGRAPRRSRSSPSSPCPSSERARPGVRAFVVVSAGAVVGFGWYAAIKGAYLSTTFSSLIVERNLMYLAPLAFARDGATCSSAQPRRSGPSSSREPRCSR